MGEARALARFRKSRAGAVGVALVGALVLFALVGPALASHDPYASDFARGATADGLPVPPGSEFWLGTDRLFRDQLSRLASGARVSLAIALAATALSTALGALAGIVAGWYEGTRGALGLNADVAVMRLVDVGLSFPFLLLVMALGAALERTTALTVLVVLGLTSWLGTARVVRAKTMQVRSLDYVTAARALGQPLRRVLTRHVLPNVSGPLVVIATAQVAQMIVAEAVLSYLGVGLPPQTATWGQMLYEGQDNFVAAPWTLAVPAAALVVAVLGFNLLGEGLRDALDPKD